MLPSRKTRLVALLIFSLPTCSALQQSSRQMHGSAVQDYALLGFRFASVKTQDYFSCAHRCLSHDQCKSYNFGAEQGLCELNSEGSHDGSTSLHYKPGFMFVNVALRKTKPVKSCLDHWKNGARVSRIYRILGNNIIGNFDVYCDFSSESDWIWTLIMSQSMANKNVPELKTKPFDADAPLNEDQPNWEAYRLSLKRMQFLKSQSTHLRITCSYPTFGVDYIDYMRANFTEFDPFTVRSGQSPKVERMNVRGHDRSSCLTVWWQSSSTFLHMESAHAWSASNACGPSPGFVSREDNFGLYNNRNVDFRCSSSNEATTNHCIARNFRHPVAPSRKRHQVSR